MPSENNTKSKIVWMSINLLYQLKAECPWQISWRERNTKSGAKIRRISVDIRPDFTIPLMTRWWHQLLGVFLPSCVEIVQRWSFTKWHWSIIRHWPKHFPFTTRKWFQNEEHESRNRLNSATTQPWSQRVEIRLESPGILLRMTSPS